MPARAGTVGGPGWAQASRPGPAQFLKPAGPMPTILDLSTFGRPEALPRTRSMPLKRPLATASTAAPGAEVSLSRPVLWLHAASWMPLAFSIRGISKRANLM